VVMIEKQDQLLTVTLERVLRCCGKLGFVLESQARRGAVIVLFLQFDFAADLYGSNAVGDVCSILLMIEGRPFKVQPEACEWSIGEECVESLLITGDALRIGIVAGLHLQDTWALYGGAIGYCGASGTEIEILCRREGNGEEGYRRNE
jgi:hypothetical protein